MRATQRADRRPARVEYLLPHGSGSAFWARRLTRAFLAGRSADATYDAMLVVSELVANAARIKDSHCRFSLCLNADELTVSVHDDSPRLPSLTPPPVPLYAESGRGISLVHALSRDLTIVAGPHGGKTVRAVLAQP
ncbi:ATP-binding protein [Streptomyces sp. NPDC046821]|uniref:ATP-binding protein n=1 Tax=Streptomyces sp. NPDC046821 TaxID=3154702 RepID=UPI0033FC3509